MKRSACCRIAVLMWLFALFFPALFVPSITVAGENSASLEERLQSAVWGNDIPQINTLLDNGADINKEIYGLTPLMIAVARSSLEVVKLLLDRGAKPNITKQNKGWTALIYVFYAERMRDTSSDELQKPSIVRLFNRPGMFCKAVKFHWKPPNGSQSKRRVSLIKMLLTYGLDPNSMTPVGNILMWACVNGYADIARQAIEKGADVNRSYWQGYTAMRLAAMSGRRDMVKLLKEHGAVTNLHIAAMIGDVEAVERFLESGADLTAKNECGRTPLMEAAWSGDTAAMHAILRKLTHHDQRKAQCASAFRTAAWMGATKAAKVLIKEGIDVNAVNDQGSTALIDAAWTGDLTIARLLLDNGAEVDIEDGFGKTALDRAIEMGHTDMAELLFSNGAVLDQTEESGWTIIDTALQRSDPAMVKLLCKHGAKTTLNIAVMIGDRKTAQRLIESGVDINTVDNFGRTALMWATAMDRAKLVEFLIDKGAKVNVHDKSGWTPLLWAARNGRTDTARLLLDKGADINAASMDGMTSLMWASRNGNVDMVKLLMDNDVNLNMETGWGLTPLDFAVENSHNEISAILRSHGAKGEPVTKGLPSIPN